MEKNVWFRAAEWIQKWIIGEYGGGCAGFLPLLIGGALLAKKFLGGLGEKKQLKEQARAAKEGFEARKATHAAGQTIRGGKLDAVQGLLGGLKGSLAAGAPSYQFDPTAFEKMKTVTPYSEAAPADVSKGAGYGLAGDMVGGVADLASTYLAGKAGETEGGGVQSVGFNPQTYTPFKPTALAAPQFPEMTEDNPFGVKR